MVSNPPSAREQLLEEYGTLQDEARLSADPTLRARIRARQVEIERDLVSLGEIADGESGEPELAVYGVDVSYAKLSDDDADARLVVRLKLEDWGTQTSAVFDPVVARQIGMTLVHRARVATRASVLVTSGRIGWQTAIVQTHTMLSQETTAQGENDAT